MRYIIISVFVVFLCFCTADAQVSGYQGKRFIVKTDLMAYPLDRSFNVSFEYACFRRLSFGFEFRRVNRGYKQDFYMLYEYEGEFPDEKAETTQNYWIFQFRFYGNSGFPSPKGSFTYFNAGYGSYDVTGITTRYEVGVFEEGYVLKEYKAENIRVMYYEAGWGYQWLLGKWVALEASGGVAAAQSIAGVAAQDINSMDNHVGPNTFSFTGFNSGSLATKWAVGPSIHVRLGILLPF